MRTVGWENWQPLVGDMNQSFGTVTAQLLMNEFCLYVLDSDATACLPPFHVPATSAR